MKTFRFVGVLFILLASGCGEEGVRVRPEDRSFGDAREVDLGTDPWRNRRRMDIDQLDRSIREVTGGIGWESWERDAEGEWKVEENHFEAFRGPLGVPDYINRTEEDRAVSLLFVKFLDDAARDVCRRLVAREAGEGRPYDGEPQGVFLPIDVTDPSPPSDDVDEVLRRLLMRFHGRSMGREDPHLGPWRVLYDRLLETAASSEGSSSPQRAWEGMCVALITHPDFYTY